MQVKVCGITNRADASLVTQLGADFIGFIFSPTSPRFVDASDVLSIVKNLAPVKKVAVFRNQTREEILDIIHQCPIDYLQFHGDESVEFIRQFDLPCIKAFHLDQNSDLAELDEYRPFVDFFLIESKKAQALGGGSGFVADWNIADKLQKISPVMLSGGLNCDNVRKAVMAIHPSAIDVCSGVEESVRIKSKTKLLTFFRQIEDLRT